MHEHCMHAVSSIAHATGFRSNSIPSRNCVVKIWIKHNYFFNAIKIIIIIEVRSVVIIITTVYVTYACYLIDVCNTCGFR